MAPKWSESHTWTSPSRYIESNTRKLFVSTTHNACRARSPWRAIETLSIKSRSSCRWRTKRIAMDGRYADTHTLWCLIYMSTLFQIKSSRKCAGEAAIRKFELNDLYIREAHEWIAEDRNDMSRFGFSVTEICCITDATEKKMRQSWRGASIPPCTHSNARTNSRHCENDKRERIFLYHWCCIAKPQTNYIPAHWSRLSCYRGFSASICTQLARAHTHTHACVCVYL